MNLILDSYGTVLMKKDNHLVVKNKEGSFDIDPSKIDAIFVSKGAIISSDAIIYAAENSIDLVFIDRKGGVKARVWSPNISSVTVIRRRQLEFTFSTEAVRWVKQILTEKITNQIAVILAFYGKGQGYDFEVDITKILNKLQDYRKKIEAVKGDFISEVASSLRGWEGAASKLYFSVIGRMVPQQYQTGQRSQHPARDVFNAMLNYAYGILYGKIEAALIRAGVDPYVGVLHREDYGRPVLTFDVIEKYRHWADFVVISLLRQQVIDQDSYSVDSQGGYWLEGLGKRILIQAMYDYLEEEIQVGDKRKTRQQQIDDFAFSLAKKFLRFRPKNKPFKDLSISSEKSVKNKK